MQAEWHRAKRSHSWLTFMICDVDHFKAYNDTYGHPEGDRCLHQIARVIPHASISISQLIQAADRALYQAKQLGRDRAIAAYPEALGYSSLDPVS